MSKYPFLKWPPDCDDCGKELTSPGAIVLSPPDEHGNFRKNHLCVVCYLKWFGKLKKWKEQNPKLS